MKTKLLALLFMLCAVPMRAHATSCQEAPFSGVFNAQQLVALQVLACAIGPDFANWSCANESNDHVQCSKNGYILRADLYMCDQIQHCYGIVTHGSQSVETFDWFKSLLTQHGFDVNLLTTFGTPGICRWVIRSSTRYVAQQCLQ